MAGRPLRVLILEDRPEDADLARHELHRAGYDLNWRRVDDEAGFKANVDPELDLILADYHQPQFNAIRALKIMQDMAWTSRLSSSRVRSGRTWRSRPCV